MPVADIPLHRTKLPTNMISDSAIKTDGAHVNGGVHSKANSFHHPLDPLSPNEVRYITTLKSLAFTYLSFVITADRYRSPYYPSSYRCQHRTQSYQVYHMYSTSPTQESRPCISGHFT